MRLVRTRLVAPVGCGLCPRVWLWHSGVIGCLSVWPRQLDVIGTHEFGAAWLMRFVPAFVAVAVGCGSWPKREAVAVGFGWRPRIW